MYFLFETIDELSQLSTLSLMCSYLLLTETNPIGAGIQGCRTLALKAIKPSMAVAELKGMIWAEMNHCTMATLRL